jgi:hypothetical protein
MGIVKLVGTYRKPEPNIMKYASVTTLMGQQLCDPPTVEGWHTGREWIDGGALNERVNFAVNEVGDVSKPGVVKIIERVKESDVSAPTALVERCLELTGPVQVGDDTRRALMRYAEATQGEPEEDRVRGMLQLIVSTREYQFA